MRRGQVMLITVVVLGSTLLATSALAGLLMLYQIRQSTDITSATKALFAADAGIEWWNYNYKCDPTNPYGLKVPCTQLQKPAMTNDADFSAAQDPVATTTIRSTGFSPASLPNKTYRALEETIQ